MTIRNQTVKVNRGDTVTLFVALTNADGTPFDPSVSVVMKWRLAKTSHTPEDKALVRKSLGDGLTLVTESPKGVNIALSAGDTDFFPGLYYHELKIWDGNDVTTAMTGTFIIRRVIKMGDIVSPAQQDLSLSATVPTRTP
jgi:hypothetical protein